MAKITKIKATDSKEVEKKTKKQVNTEVKLAPKEDKKEKKGFILFRPFKALFGYIRDSWHEIPQVRWPNRKATWKMVLAVLVYTALFVVLITLLDVFFSWLFGNIIK